jgi:hypothetical protein
LDDVMHETRPLAAYIQGNLRLFMRSGQHVLRIDEATAHRLRMALDRGEPADSVREGGFLQIDPAAIDALEFIADGRQPSTESRTDRELRRRGGELFHGGWLRTLYDLAPTDAGYSIAGLVAWKAAAMLLVLDEEQTYAELDRREVLSALSRLWNNVASPEDVGLRDFADLRSHDDEPHTRATTPEEGDVGVSPSSTRGVEVDDEAQPDGDDPSSTGVDVGQEP